MSDDGIRTMAELFEAWLRHLSRLGRSPTTLASYRYKIDAALLPAIGDLELVALSVRRVDQLYGELLEGGMSPASVNHHHRILRAALGQAARWGLIASNPARLATPPRSRPAASPPPTPAQVRQMIEAARSAPSPLLGSVIMLAATTGMRRGELAGLRWSAVDLERRQIAVATSIWQVSSRWGEKPPKSHQHRRLPFGARTAELLEGLIAETGAHAAHFVLSRSGGPDPFLPESITRSFGRLLRSLEATTGERWPFRFHDLRHFTATELFRAGHSAKTVASRLGHADVAVTLRTYAHDTDDQARRAAEEIEREL